MADSEIQLAIAEVKRWAAHVQRFAYERADVGPDASPHMLAAAAEKLAALVEPETAHG